MDFFFIIGTVPVIFFYIDIVKVNNRWQRKNKMWAHRMQLPIGIFFLNVSPKRLKP